MKQIKYSDKIQLLDIATDKVTFYCDNKNNYNLTKALCAYGPTYIVNITKLMQDCKAISSTVRSLLNKVNQITKRELCMDTKRIYKLNGENFYDIPKVFRQDISLSVMRAFLAIGDIDIFALRSSDDDAPPKLSEFLWHILDRMAEEEVDKGSGDMVFYHSAYITKYILDELKDVEDNNYFKVIRGKGLIADYLIIDVPAILTVTNKQKE